MMNLFQVEQSEIMTNDKLNKYLNNKTIKKKIYIKDKLLNIIL